MNRHTMPAEPTPPIKNLPGDRALQGEVGSGESMDEKQADVWWRPAVVIFGEVTGWIVIPVVGALYLGRYLDDLQRTGNLYFLSLTALAFVISCTGIGIVGVKYIRQLEQQKKSDEHEHTDNRNK